MLSLSRALKIKYYVWFAFLFVQTVYHVGSKNHKTNAFGDILYTNLKIFFIEFTRTIFTSSLLVSSNQIHPLSVSYLGVPHGIC